MKIVHLSDLHIGRSVSGVPMIEEQRMVLFGQIIPEVRKSGAGAVIIAGDVFDRANPAADAITLFDDFLAGLAMLETKPEIFIISGNHNSFPLSSERSLLIISMPSRISSTSR